MGACGSGCACGRPSHIGVIEPRLHHLSSNIFQSHPIALTSQLLLEVFSQSQSISLSPVELVQGGEDVVWLHDPLLLECDIVVCAGEREEGGRSLATQKQGRRRAKGLDARFQGTRTDDGGRDLPKSLLEPTLLPDS